MKDVNKPIDILYLCDHKACKKCSDYCLHTKDKEYAIHKDDLDGRKFEYVDMGRAVGFFEVEDNEDE